MELRTAPLRVSPKSIFIEIVDGRRVGVAFVKGTHLLRDTFRIPASCCLLFHDACVARSDPMHGSDRAWVGDIKARRHARGSQLRSPDRAGLSGLTVVSYLSHHRVEVERGGLLPRRELGERCD